jgi:glycosyltransferase involved in cell wall biosynthesis
MTSQYACGIAKVLGIRFVNGMVTASDDMSWQEKKFWKAQVTYFLSDRVMGNSDAGLKAYRVPRRKAVRIYNGFDFERLKNLDRPEDVKKRFGIQASHVVGMVASFSKSKDYETLILAGKKILQKRNDVAFVTIGDGENLEAMKRLAGQDNFSRILFLGKQKDIESIVNIFDVGVLATYTEGLSNSIMEYMALAKPVVATDGGGTKELVLDGITGFLVRPQSPDELAERIEYILDNSERAQAMGIAGRERIEKEFSIQKMSKEVTSLYDELIGNRSSLS